MVHHNATNEVHSTSPANTYNTRSKPTYTHNHGYLSLWTYNGDTIQSWITHINDSYTYKDPPIYPLNTIESHWVNLSLIHI